MPPGDRVRRLQRRAGRRGERRVGEVGDAAPRAGQRRRQVGGIGVGQPVLDGFDTSDRAALVQLGDADVGEPDRCDLAFLTQFR